MSEKRKRGRPRKAEYIMGQKPELTPRQWHGLEVEICNFDPRERPWPSKAPPTVVARRAGVSHAAVNKWRQQHNYRVGFFWLLVTLDIRLSRSPLEQPRQPRQSTTKRQNMALFASQNRDWTGPVRSPIDGNLYETRESYLAHINEHAELRWIEEPEKVGRKLAKSVR